MDIFRLVVEIAGGVGVVIALLAPFYNRIAKSVKEQNAKTALVQNALIALLHDRICGICEELIKKGYASMEERKKLEVLYIPYKEMGGNHTAEGLYEIVNDLPLNR